MSTFEDAFEKVVGHEGGLSMVRSDRGNWNTGIVGRGELRGTKYGISAMSYPTTNIAALTLDQAREIYRKDFWNRLGCDRFTSSAVAFNVFDAAVNSGPGRSAQWLQEAVGAEADGIIGSKTIAATNALHEATVCLAFNAIRLAFITDLPDVDWSTFGRGLCRRVASNMRI